MHVEPSKRENRYAHSSCFFGSTFHFSLWIYYLYDYDVCRTLHKGTQECKHGETATWLFIS